MAKEIVKLNVASAAVASAIANDVKEQLAQGKSVLARYRPYIKLVADGNMDASPMHARLILLRVRERMVAHRKSVHDGRPVAKVQDSRVSELVSIIKLGTFKCWPTVLAYFDGHDMNFDDLLQVARFVRSQVKGDMKKSADAAPAKDRCLRAIKVRKTQRRGDAAPSPVANVTNPVTSLAMIKRQVRGLAKWFGRDKPRFIDEVMKHVANIEVAAKKTVKARADAAEAEAA